MEFQEKDDLFVLLWNIYQKPWCFWIAHQFAWAIVEKVHGNEVTTWDNATWHLYLEIPTVVISEVPRIMRVGDAEGTGVCPAKGMVYCHCLLSIVSHIELVFLFLFSLAFYLLHIGLLLRFLLLSSMKKLAVLSRIIHVFHKISSTSHVKLVFLFSSSSLTFYLLGVWCSASWVIIFFSCPKS